MQANRGLIEDVEHAHQLRPDLGGQPNPLGFAAGQGIGRTGQIQVVETNVDQELKAFANFLQNAARDQCLTLGQLKFPEPLLSRVDR